MSRTRNVSRNIGWGVIEKLISLGIPFIMRTVMIYTLGELFLGLNGLFTSVLQVLNVAELGISTAIVYSMYKPLAEQNVEEVCALLSLYKKCYRVIGTIVLVLGLICIPFLENLISGDIPKEVNIYILYLMNLISIVLSYQLFSYRTSLLIANQRNDIVSRVRVIVIIIQSLFQFLSLLYFRNYYLYIACIIIGTVLNNVIAAIICKRIYPQYICKGKVSKSVINDIRKKVSGMLFQKIGGIVLAAVDTIIISAFLGLRTLAIYQNYYYIITALFGVLGIIMSSMIAPIGNSIVTESVKKNYKDFKKFNFIYVWIISWCTICLLCIYQPFMKIWVGEELMLPTHLVCLFAVYFFTHKWCDMLYIYQDACGIWWETKYIPLAAATLNLVANIIMVKVIGLAGVLISTIISVVFVYDIGYSIVLFKVYFKQKSGLKLFFIRQMFYLVSMITSIYVTGYLCSFTSNYSDYMQLIINSIICLFVPNIIFIILYHRLPEFHDTIYLMKGLLRKKLKHVF